MTDPSGAPEAVQLSLLQGFGASRRPAGTSPTASVLPIARVALESPVPHLDRLFDYTVPEKYDAEAQPGARVKVRFGAQELPGFIIERAAEPATGVRLVPLAKVVSGEPVLTPEVVALARAVADRYAGTFSDVLRAAVPPRVARVDKEFAAGGDVGGEADGDTDGDLGPNADSAVESSAPDGPSLLSRYAHGSQFLAHLAAGETPRAVFTSLGGYGAQAWPHELAEAAAAARRAGKGVLIVVPDQRDLARLQDAFAARIGAGSFVRLNADDGPTPRYRNFLRLVHGQVNVAIGTRSAAFAPVSNLGLVVLWDDGDELHAEPRAPYQHAREVLLLRAEQAQCALLIGGFARSTEAQRLVAAGWALPIQADRPTVRNRTPRIVNSADSYQQERDPLAARARLPHVAWRTAREALERGPVLVQVARTGFSPALACQDCREPARCAHCQGPLAQGSRAGQPACRWCGQLAGAWQCINCGGRRLRATAVGAARTAEELGRAFPTVPVISSAGDHVRDTVGPEPALVVATPGAEPVPAAGYAAALLLDGTMMLGRESLRTAEDTLRRWFNAAALVRPAGSGGTVVVTADDGATVGSLVRWDPAGAAERELGLRQELHLPPAVRYASLSGSAAALEGFVSGLQLPGQVRLIGPTPVEETYQGQGGSRWGDHRTLVFFPYRAAAEVTAQLRSRRAALSARKTGDPVNIRLDAVDML